MLLPKTVRRVLSSKVEVAPQAQDSVLLAAARSDVMLVEVAEEPHAEAPA
jgi:uncharacterized protein (UPF0147 family)